MKTSIEMAVATVQIDMDVVKFQPGDGVHKVLAIPRLVAVIAVSIHLRNSLSGWMARGAVQLTVVPTQAPMVGVVLKRWLLFIAVTFVALIPLVAIHADGMNLFARLLRCNGRRAVVTVATRLFLVTVCALQAEQVHVLIVIESHLLAFGVWRVIDSLVRFDDTVLSNIRNSRSGY